MPYHYRNGRLIKIPTRTEWGLIAVEVSGLYAKPSKLAIAIKESLKNLSRFRKQREAIIRSFTLPPSGS